MKSQCSLVTLIAGLALSGLLGHPQAHAAFVTKANNTNALGEAASWVGGVAPTSADVATWAGVYSADLTTNTLRAVLSPAAHVWGGLRVGSLAGTALTTNTFTVAETNITAASQSGNLVTVTTRANHGFAPGQSVTIAGVTPAGYNGTFTIVGVPSATTFTYLTDPGLSPASGFGTVESAIYIGGVGSATANSTLIVGAAGIDLSAASHSVALVATGFAFVGNQTWNVAAGRNLRFGGGGVSAASAKAVSSGSDGLIDISGNGVVDANQGGGTGFADAGGFTGFSGKWRINSGATLRGLRNGATAWGSNPSADSITLNGGTLAVGGISAAVGNWTWTNGITLAAGTTSAIDNHNVTGSGRFLKLNGAISGTGTLVFKDSLLAGTFTNPDLGYILTGPNTLSGVVVIGGPNENGIAGRLTYLRVGGVGGSSTATGIGPDGTLGTAVITNNGLLTFSLNGPLTVNSIHGTGSLRVGYTPAAGAENQNITLTGLNTYSGDTRVNMGTLTLAAGASIPNTANIYLTPFTSASLITAMLDASPAGGLTLHSGQRLVGGPNNTANNNSSILNGNVIANNGSVIVPGGSNTFNNLTFNNNLTLNACTVVMDVTASSSDKLTVNGDLTPTGLTTIQVVNTGGLANGDYPLIEVYGNLHGSPANFNITGLVASGTRQTFSVAYDTTVYPKLVVLRVGGSPALDLTWWGGTSGNLWDVTGAANWTTNFTDREKFFNNDRVYFTDFGVANSPVVLSGTLLPAWVTVDTSGNYVFSGTGKIGGGAGLSKTGAGTLFLNASNDFAGATVIEGGTVVIPTERALGVAPVSLVTTQLTLNGGALGVTNSLTLQETNRGITLGASGGGFHVAAGQTLTISNRIAGATGTLTKTGAGTLILTANNTYNGDGTVIDGGTVVCATGFALGQRASGGTFSPGFTLREGVLDIAGQSNYSNPSVGTSNHFLFTDSTLVFGGKSGATTELIDSVAGHHGFGAGYQQQAPEIAIRYDATTAPNPGKAVIRAPWYAVGTGVYPRTYTIQVEDSTATTEELEFAAQMSALEYEGKVATIQKTGAGTLKISASNYYPGLQVTEGLLLVNHDLALGADRAPNWGGWGTGNPHVVTVDGGTIDLNGFNPRIGALADGGVTTGVILNNGAALSTLTVGYSPSNTVFNATFGGTIANGSGGVALVKEGTGTQRLTGANTYTGLTTISNGTLVVNGSLAGAVSVQPGATLAGNGTITGVLTINPGGMVSPGEGIGTLTLGSAPVLNGTLVMELDRNAGAPLADKLVVSGRPITYGGTLILTNTGAPLQAGDTFQLFSASGYSGAFTLISQTPGQVVAWNTVNLTVNGTISVSGAIPAEPPQLTHGVVGNLYEVSWPTAYVGCQLQVQTNSLAVGLSTNWYAWPGSTTTNRVFVPIVPSNPTVFLRLVFPPQP